MLDDFSFGQSLAVIPLDPDVSSPASSTTGADVVVMGERVHRFSLDEAGGGGSGFGGGTGSGGGSGGDGGGGAGGGEWSTYDQSVPPPVADDQAIDIAVQTNRPLTPDELQALADLQVSIAKVNTAVNALADDAVLSLPNGAHVNGAQMKAAWRNLDFVIVDNGVPVGNDSNRGSANPNGGNPIVTFNIGTVDGYNNALGSMNYLVAHELGHISQAAIFQGTTFSIYYQDERTANDIARALLHGAELLYLDNSGYGYTSSAPMSFSTPSGTGGDTGGTGGGGNGGGGGGGGGGWYNPDTL